MAMDEALLEFAARLERPVLRCYRWSEPAATFGYSQRYAEVARWTDLRPLIRRPTGGGLVPHDADWTYSLVFPPGHSWHQLKAWDSYERIHEWIRRAFAAIGVATQLSAREERPGPGQCFVGAERFDLLWNGKKIAGAAQRRNKLGLLIQGSVQPRGLLVARGDWERGMRETPHWGETIQWISLEPGRLGALDDVFASRVEQLARDKYSQTSYNQRR